jgi:hypothetical protein
MGFVRSPGSRDEDRGDAGLRMGCTAASFVFQHFGRAAVSGHFAANQTLR